MQKMGEWIQNTFIALRQTNYILRDKMLSIVTTESDSRTLNKNVMFPGCCCWRQTADHSDVLHFFLQRRGCDN